MTSLFRSATQEAGRDLGPDRTASAQLKLENQRIKTEIFKIVDEVVDTFTPGEELTSQEWYWVLSSCVEAQILQSNYDDLWERHLNSSCAITADLYAEMVRKHKDLQRLYEQALKSHAVLQDGIQRFTLQLTVPPGVRTFMPIALLLV